MREIKFRAWDGQEMYYTDQKNIELHVARYGWSIVRLDPDGHTELCNDENAKLMQFTGLKDSKRTKEFPEGQDIYEGDIVEVNRKHWPNKTDAVVFANGCFTVGEVGWYFWDYGIGGADTVHVLGNIHQNPELLG